ncbi:unnamed protein product [Larinioides sclopetarius]|uniref:Uncharacterized protein n=1 Tax=Larinioides sclopetarius TaxID=280406 RepID=A0AAV1YU13_9ARAC
MDGIQSSSKGGFLTIRGSGEMVAVTPFKNRRDPKQFYNTLNRSLNAIKTDLNNCLVPVLEEDKRKRSEGPSQSPKPSKKAKKIII